MAEKKTEEQKKNEREISFLIVGAAAVVAINRLWVLRVRPWLTRSFGILHDEQGAPMLRIFGARFSMIDVIATLLLILCTYIIIRVLHARLRREADRRQRDRREERLSRSY